MTGFSEMPGQGPAGPGRNPENLSGFEVEPLPPQGGDYPGRTLGIVGFVLAFFFSLIGLIVSIVAYNQSKKAGRSNGWAVAGIWVGAIEILLGAVLAVLFLATGFALIGVAGNSGS